MKKRILALALSLCMMLSMMPTAYAGEGFLTLDGQQPEVSQPQEQPQQQEGFLTLDGQLPESDEPSRQPEEGVLTLDQPDLEVQEPTVLTLVADEAIRDDREVIGTTIGHDQYGNRFYLQLLHRSDGSFSCNGVRRDTQEVGYILGMYRIVGVL